MGAAGLETHPMVGVDTSLPELPGIPTNESAKTIPCRSKASTKAFWSGVGETKQNKH